MTLFWHLSLIFQINSSPVLGCPQRLLMSSTLNRMSALITVTPAAAAISIVMVITAERRGLYPREGAPQTIGIKTDRHNYHEMNQKEWTRAELAGGQHCQHLGTQPTNQLFVPLGVINSPKSDSHHHRCDRNCRQPTQHKSNSIQNTLATMPTHNLLE